MWGDIISGIGSIVGGFFGRDAAKDNASRQADLQKQFAKSGIQWRVEDAKKAGVHPIYALGANTTSYTPQSVGDPLGGAISEASQSFGRAINHTMTSDERVASKVLTDLHIERAKLQNDQLRLDIAASTNRLMTQPGTGKPTPGVGGPVPQETSVDAAPRVFYDGSEIIHSPGYSSGDTYEKAYQSAGELMSAVKFIRDIERTTGKTAPNLVFDWLNEHADKLGDAVRRQLGSRKKYLSPAPQLFGPYLFDQRRS